MTDEVNVFDALNAALEGEDDYYDDVPAMVDEEIYRVPVQLFKDENGSYFYLKKNSFPNHSITKLKILYGDNEKQQVKEQVLADNRCPEITLKNCPIMCYLSGKKDEDGDDGYLNDAGFRLSGSKIRAIRMKMYSQQKQAAQSQLEDPDCRLVKLTLDIECSLMPK